ncbi:cytochrome P450 3A41-like isoform X1 [Panulirus ornatus]|uniref:cytochrome P450 3A41-like isoform X1 n=1 Tax=Panulirus ornatus TaxID=150431 RepID=UPI003A86CFB2
MGVEAWLLVGVVVLAAWAYSRWRHTYWSSRGVPTPPFLPFLGHVHKLFSASQGRWVFDDEVYTKYGGSTFCGTYEMLKPVLMIGDPDLLKQVLVKDFDHFTDRRTFNLKNENEKVMNDLLTVKTGEDWKNLRAIMTPTFTSGKIRGMFPLVCDIANTLVSFSLKQAAIQPSVNMKDNFGRFTMDTIASCAFGIECNSFEDNNAEFPKKASPFFSLTFGRWIRFLLLLTLPSLFKVLKLRFNPPELDFFMEVVKETITARQKGHTRGDFLDLLLEARAGLDNPNQKKVLDDSSMVAQSILFLLAGYDTTASTLAFSSFLLAKHQQEQLRLRQELQDMVREHGGVTYQGILEAKFLDACLMETLRLYPPIPISERVCTKEYQIPGTDLVVTPGNIIQLPIWSLQHDPHYWPQPDQFRPDRFMPENKGNIKSFTHMPFGMGPRNCIAMRFALLEAKVALAKMILAADLQLAPGHEEIVLEFGTGVMRPRNGVHLVLTSLREE